MQITVEKYNDVIFEGDADDFLFNNDNDTDLELALNDLDEQKVGSSVNAYDNNGDIVKITKGTVYAYVD